MYEIIATHPTALIVEHARGLDMHDAEEIIQHFQDEWKFFLNDIEVKELPEYAGLL
jgi:hypothetical protein